MAAYGEHKFKNQGGKINTISIGSSLDCQIHGLLTRVFDLQGFGSKRATLPAIERELQSSYVVPSEKQFFFSDNSYRRYP